MIFIKVESQWGYMVRLVVINKDWKVVACV